MSHQSGAFYWSSVWDVLTFENVFSGAAKPFFGYLIACISCYMGLSTKGGSEGQNRLLPLVSCCHFNSYDYSFRFYTHKSITLCVRIFSMIYLIRSRFSYIPAGSKRSCVSPSMKMKGLQSSEKAGRVRRPYSN